MAEKTPPTDPKIATDSATQVVEDLMTKAQTQYLTVLTESQNLALDAYKTMVDSVSKLNLPAMPVMPGVPSMTSFTQMPASILETAFDFSAALLENQRSFARKVFEVSAS